MAQPNRSESENTAAEPNPNPYARAAAIALQLPQVYGASGSFFRTLAGNREMASQSQLDTQLMGIGYAITMTRHSVPDYQRSYAWRERNVSDLLDDFESAIHDSAEEYFLGSIVVATGENVDPEVVDGQQRLATTIILIAEIRNYLAKHGHQQKADELTRKYIASSDLRTDDLVAQMRLNDVDNPYFADRIVAPPAARSRVSPSLESHRRLDAAATLIEKRVRKIAETAGKNFPARLIDWIEFMHHRAKIIRLAVPNHANAFVLFETLNDRGLTLAVSDLLKNFLFSKSGVRLAEAKADWTGMTSVLESVGGDEVVVDYIRHLWSSTHGLVRERKLYDEIKAEVMSPGKAVALVQDLREKATLYCALLNSGHPFWRTFNDTARRYVAALNALQATEIRPLLLAVVTRFNSGQCVKALRLLTACTVRSLLVSGRGMMESRYSALARAVSEGTIRNERQLRDSIRSLIPTDDEFQRAFATTSVSNSIRVRYLLREIERIADGGTGEWIPSESIDDVSLEHILPKVPADGWPEFDDDQHRAYLNRLGNQAIIAATWNSEVGAQSFANKRKFYDESSFVTTCMISVKAVKAWTPAAIENRQEKLAQWAVKAWPVSGDVPKLAAMTKQKVTTVSTKRATKKSAKTSRKKTRG